MKKIPLSGKRGEGKYVLVDDEDYDKVMDGRTWNLDGDGYARRHKLLKDDPKRGAELMHRFIVGEENIPKGKQVDHNNGNRLDNRRDNLRICTCAQNSHNSSKPKMKNNSDRRSQFKGVRECAKKGRYQSRIRCDNKSYHIGVYDYEVDAAIAYNRTALSLFGDFASINTVPVPSCVSAGILNDLYGKYIGKY